MIIRMSQMISHTERRKKLNILYELCISSMQRSGTVMGLKYTYTYIYNTMIVCNIPNPTTVPEHCFDGMFKS